MPFQNSGSGTLGNGVYGADIAYKTKVQVVVGDTELRNERPALVKIDVEGFEFNVLSGMIETIKQGKSADNCARGHI